jgi:hypothetical protein
VGELHPVLEVDTASARLAYKLDLLRPAFGTPGRLVLEHPNARELFPRYLADCSYLTLLMVPLMEVALERARVLAAGDPVAAGLAEYLEKHIPEELHGGAPGRAALDDLEALGVDTEAFRRSAPPPKTASFVGTLYYWMWHRHPVAILGFLALEAFHPETESVELLIERTGLPRDGFRQLLLHARLDVQHARELHRVIDSLPLEPEHEELIAHVAFLTIEALVDAGLDSLVDGKEPVAAAT